MAISVSVEGVSYTISAKDVSGPEIEKAIAGTKKMTSSVDTMESKMKAQLANIQKHWLAYSAAAIAAIAAISKAWDMAETGAGYIEQMQLLDGLAKQYHTSAAAITKDILSVGDGMISMKTAAEVATSAMAKGLKPDQIVNLGKAAVTLSDIMGKTVDQTFKDLSAAMETGKEKSIKLAIGVIDLKDKYGLAADSMSEYEKQQALYNMVIEKSAEIQGAFGESTKSIADKMETFKVRLADVKLEMSMGLIRAGIGLIAVWDSLGAASLTVSSGIWKIIEVKHRLQAMVSWGEAEKKHYEAASQAAQNAAEDWKNSLKLAGQAQDGISLMTASTEELTKSQAKSNSAIKTGTTGLYEREKAAKKAAEEGEAAAKKELAAIEAALKVLVEETRKANIEIEGMNKTQYEKDIARIESEAEKHLAASKNRVAVNAWKTTQIELAEKKQADAELSNRIKIAEATHKAEMDMMREIEEGVKASLATIKKGEEEKEALKAKSLADYKNMMADEADFAATENERAINKIIAQEGEKLNKLYQIYADGGISYKAMQEAEARINANKNAAILEKETEVAARIEKLNSDLISGIRGLEGDAYQARLKEIDALAAKQIKDGADHSAAMARKRDDTEKAYADMGYKADGWFGGVKAGLIEIERAHKTWAERCKTLTLDFANASKTAISDILFQAIKTGTVDMKTVWDTFCGSMLRKLTDTIGEMVATAIAKDIMMMFKANWTSDSSNVLAIIRGAINLWDSFTSSGHYGGGLIPGQARVAGDSPRNDTHHALLSPGEYVMPRTAVTPHTLPVLEYMRSNRGLPMYAEGGVVGREGPPLDFNRMYPYLSSQRKVVVPGDEDNPPIFASLDPWDVALAAAHNRGPRRPMRFNYGGIESNPDIKRLIMDWAEAHYSSLWNYEGGSPDDEKWKALHWEGFNDADMLGQMKKPSGQIRSFYHNETYEDEYPSGGWSWMVQFMAGLTKIVSSVIVTAAAAYVSKGLLGPYLASALGVSAGTGGALATGVGVAGATYVLTGGNWQAAIIAGITAAALAGISEYFSNVGASPDTSAYLDNGEFQAWQADPSYTDALYSDAGQGSSILWWEGVMNSAKKWVMNSLAKNVIKIGLGKLGLDGSNQGHATFGYDSTDDGGIFGQLSGFMDTIAPKSTALNLNFAGGGAIPAFSDGGSHRGGWRLVGEMGPELEYTPPSRLYSHDESKSLVDNSDLVAEIRGLRADFNKIGFHLLQRANKTGKAIDGFTIDGASPVRVAMQ